MLQTELRKGETVAIVGAGGGLGHLGCQFAKALGLMVVGKLTREMKDWHWQEIVERML